LEKNNNECHGDHWEAVLSDSKKDFYDVIKTSLEDSTLVGSKNGNHLLSYREKDKYGEESPVSVKIIISEKGDSNEVMSGYPCVSNGAYVHVKIEKINEWENGLEATIEGETVSGNFISFFDTDYVLHKNEYIEGEYYWFSLAGIIYSAEVLEKGAADIELLGKEAIDFKAKIGEEPEYDENGNIKPVHFSLDNLVAFIPTECPDDVEFQSPLIGTKTVSRFFGAKIVSGYMITAYRSESGECAQDIRIPFIVAQSNFEGKPRENKPCRGMLWLHGHVVSDEEVNRFHELKQWALDHLKNLLNKEKEEPEIKREIPGAKFREAYRKAKKHGPLTYEKVPFNMLFRLWDLKKWDVELLEAVIDFRKKYNKWPTAIVASEQTYNRIEETLENGMEEGWQEQDVFIIETDDTDPSITEMYDWEDLNPDMDISDIEKLDLNRIPVYFGEKFESPFFSIDLLVDDRISEDLFRLMFGEGPGTDDGEPVLEVKTA